MAAEARGRGRRGGRRSGVRSLPMRRRGRRGRRRAGGRRELARGGNAAKAMRGAARRRELHGWRMPTVRVRRPTVARGSAEPSAAANRLATAASTTTVASCFVRDWSMGRQRAVGRDAPGPVRRPIRPHGQRRSRRRRPCARRAADAAAPHRSRRRPQRRETPRRQRSRSRRRRRRPKGSRRRRYPGRKLVRVGSERCCQQIE